LRRPGFQERSTFRWTTVTSLFESSGRHKPVVVYCASEQCNSSEKAAKKLEDAGFTAVSRYTGGAAAWQKEAGEVHAGTCG